MRNVIVPGTWCALPKGKKHMRHYLVSETLSNHRALIVWDQLSITMNFLYALVAQKHQPLSIRVSKIKKMWLAYRLYDPLTASLCKMRHFWNGCHLDSQNVQTSPSQISLIKKSVHTHVQYILTSLLYQKERHHSPQQQYHCSKDNCRRDQITTKTVYTLLGYTFRLALISDFHLIFFLLTYSVLSGGRKVRFFFVAADLVDLVFLFLV